MPISLDVDTTLSEVPVNTSPLIDDADFKTIETAVAYNAAGLLLYWNFLTTAGAYTQTQVTPTTGGNYDWTNQGNGMYTIEIPASGGASINNDTEGYGWFTGVATGVLPWRGPTICFRASALNDSLVDAGATGLLAPTAAGRTLDVTATGEAGIDWANVGGQSTAVTLSATTVNTTTTVTNQLPAATIAGAVWDELLTGATHNIATSAGRRLRALSAIASIDSSVNDAAATTTSFVSALTNATNDFYNDQLVIFTSGTLNGQSRPIADYDGTTKTITVTEAFTSAPGNGDTFTIQATHIHPITQIAQGVWASGTRTLTSISGLVVDSVTTVTGNVNGSVASVTAPVTVGTNNDKTDYALSTAGVDAIWAKTMSELAAVPGVNASALAALEWLFLLARNAITQTSTTQTLKNDAGSGNIATAAVSDDGTTFTRAEWQ